MTKRVLTIIFLFVTYYAQAQVVYSDEYGRVTFDELGMTEYVYDKAAEALVIYEQGKYSFERRDEGNTVYFLLCMTVSTKIKILHEAGLKYANIEIPYSTGSSLDFEVVEIEGATYNLVDGKMVTTPLGKNHVYNEVLQANRSIKKVAFPNVQVGSVIELKYTIYTRRYFNMRPWRFQKAIPVRSSMLTLVANPFYEYAFILKGASKFDTYSSVADVFDTQFLSATYKNTTYKFGMNNLQAFRDEEFLSNTVDYMIALYFQMSKYFVYSSGSYKELMSTWPKLCDELLKDAEFGKYIAAAAKEGKKVIPSLGLEGKSDIEKIRLITDHVKSMYSWNGSYSIVASKKVSAFLKEKTGMVGDINLYMIGLLKAAGFDVNPVVLSVRSAGKVYKAYPFVNFFNYVIGMVNVDGKAYFVDATVTLADFDEVSPECVNVEGLIVAEGNKDQWVFIKANKPASMRNDMKIVLQPETGRTLVSLMQTSDGNSALQQRTKYNGNRDNMKGPYEHKLGTTLKDVLVENFSEADKPFIVHYQYELSREEVLSEKIALNPLENLAPTDNPFKQTLRRNGVDLEYGKQNSFAVAIPIPDGYEVEHLPENKVKEYPDMVYSYAANIEGDTVVVNAEYALINFYKATDYLRLKDFYGDLVSKFSEMIIFRKKK